MTNLPNNTTDCVSYAGIALEKGAVVLSDLFVDYNFMNKPAVDLNTASPEATKLILEYKRLIAFVGIAGDYVFEARELLEHAEGLELENQGRRGLQKG